MAARTAERPQRMCDVCETSVRSGDEYGWKRHVATKKHTDNVIRFDAGLPPIARSPRRGPAVEKTYTDKEWERAKELKELVYSGTFPPKENIYFTIRVWGALKALRENKKWACWPTKTYALNHVKKWFTETDQPPAEPAQPRPAKRQRTTSQPSESSDWNQRTTEYLITTMQKHKEELEAVAQLMTYIIYCYYLQWQGTLVPIYVGQTYRDIATRDKEHLDCGRNGTEFEKFLHVFHKDIEVHELERNEKCTKDWGSDNDRCFWADEREYWHICDKKTHTGLEHVSKSLTGFNKIKVAHAKDIVKYWKENHEKAVEDAYHIQTVLKTEASI